MGQELDAQGRPRPVAFMNGRINGQYIMEGLSSSFLFVFGAIGLILLDTVRPLFSVVSSLARHFSAISGIVNFRQAHIFIIAIQNARFI